jgi:Ca2+-binding EF-hand superfamily protein
LLLAGCGDGIDKTAIKADPDKAAAAALDAYDSNSDGQIDAIELKQVAALQSALPRIDTSRD